MLKPMSDRRRS